MNKIYQLFDEKFVIDFIKKEIMPMYPHFVDVKSVKINPYKKLVWDCTYHVVVNFETNFIKENGKIKQLPIVCTAHSNEPRENVYDSLKYLWDNDFCKGYLSIPHPLYYSNYFRGTFYRGIEGKTLYSYIKDSNLSEIDNMIPKTAQWFAKLHKMPTVGVKNFNEQNSRIETVLPGMKRILNHMKNVYPDYLDIGTKIYQHINEKEKKFLKSTDQRWLVHGDAHPGNVIKMGRKKIAFIDFADICLTDFARDLGSFLQQLDYMCKRRIDDPAYIERIKQMFLDNYFNNVKIKLDDSLQERIGTYYNWTKMRTATFFLTKEDPQPSRAYKLIDEVSDSLGLK